MIINTRKDFDALPEADQQVFKARLAGTIYGWSWVNGEWVQTTNTKTIERFGFTLDDFPDAPVPDKPTGNPDEDAEAAAEREKVTVARQHATDIAMRVSVDQVIDNLPDSEVETLTFLYPPWSGDSIPMKEGQKVRYNGILYHVLQAHTSQADWTPDVSSSLFTRFRDPAGDPQPWVQPEGGHDAYQIDDKVTHNGQTWISTVADNVWEPSVHGWDIYDESK